MAFGRRLQRATKPQSAYNVPDGTSGLGIFVGARQRR